MIVLPNKKHYAKNSHFFLLACATVCAQAQLRVLPKGNILTGALRYNEGIDQPVVPLNTGGSGFEIGTGGEVTIICDGEITINGGTIRKGGKLTIRAKNTTINCSFNVEQGANVTIEKL